MTANNVLSIDGVVFFKINNQKNRFRVENFKLLLHNCTVKEDVCGKVELDTNFFQNREEMGRTLRKSLNKKPRWNYHK
jgi:regulator of protease activity HflC (stomatin/prohibitin superfamily)